MVGRFINNMLTKQNVSQVCILAACMEGGKTIFSASISLPLNSHKLHARKVMACALFTIHIFHGPNLRMPSKSSNFPDCLTTRTELSE